MIGHTKTQITTLYVWIILQSRYKKEAQSSVDLRSFISSSDHFTSMKEKKQTANILLLDLPNKKLCTKLRCIMKYLTGVYVILKI